MGHLLTATDTFKKDHGSAANVVTRDHHCRHEPQQIDYILPSDVSLRPGTFDSSSTVFDHWSLTARKPIVW